ncbi:MAG: hypothetical protein ACYDEB_05165 [Dehalococcoidia bacterium]
MPGFDVTVEEEIGQLNMGRPHVVILGAGASRAAVLNGDKHGRHAPLMDDLVQVIGLAGLLSELGIEHEGRKFEDIFTELNPVTQAPGRAALEDAVSAYFDRLELPDAPTIYDHLVLSLRKKDLIATFNWDPFLLQAYSRNGGSRAPLPRLAFLHGNVQIGYCAADRTTGRRDDNCSKCGKPRIRAPLLFPIKQKDYAADAFIANEWALLKTHLQNAFWVTIFGYSAPRTDQEALGVMQTAWGGGVARPMEQIEIISIDEPDRLRDDWEPFIHSHHYDIVSDFYQSWVANHPRRTGEAYRNQYLDAKFISDNPIPRGAPFSELREWIAPLVRREGFVMGMAP